MATKRWRTWSVWALGLAALVGLGFFLDAVLPPLPRFVLRGSHNIPSITPDGSILTTGTLERGEDGDATCVSLKAWDTSTGQQRGEFFRNLTANSLIITDGYESGLAKDAIVYSPDKRYCSVLHHGGLALADLRTGSEWPAVVKSIDADQIGPQTALLCRYLQKRIDARSLRGQDTVKGYLDTIEKELGAKLPIVVNKEAFAEKWRDDAPDFFEIGSHWDGGNPRGRVGVDYALRAILAEVGAEYRVRRDFIEITTDSRARHERMWTPVFSPHGSFVAIIESRPRENKLHVVECATGHLLASLSIYDDGHYHPGRGGDFGFSGDEELLYYTAPEQEHSVFSAWSTKTKKVERTFSDWPVNLDFAPDGKTILANRGADGVDLLDLRTGQKRRLVGKIDRLDHFTFLPDNQTLVQHKVAGQLELWDLPTGKRRCSVALGANPGFRPALFVAANSRAICMVDGDPPSFKAWSLDTGERLRPGVEPDEWYDRQRLESKADLSPKFTPDRRFFCQRISGRINFLDPATGAAQASLAMDETATDPAIIAFTPDGRRMLSQWDYLQRKPWWGQEWLAKWWPTSAGCFIVSEVATGEIWLRVNYSANPQATAIISDDGRTLMTSIDEGDGPSISCWDVPGRPSRWLVIGIPASLGVVGLAAAWWVKRRKKSPASLTLQALKSPPDRV